jgi:hypothetical protein
MTLFLTRRRLITFATLFGAVARVPVVFAAKTKAVLVVYDSRTAQGSGFVTLHGGIAIDVAQEDSRFWRSLRTPLGNGSIVGLTSWSDYVLARGLLEEQGKRLQHERRDGRLFRWTMR